MTVNWVELTENFRASPTPRWKLTTAQGEVKEGVVTHIPAEDVGSWTPKHTLYFGGRDIGAPFRLGDIISLKRIG